MLLRQPKLFQNRLPYWIISKGKLKIINTFTVTLFEFRGCDQNGVSAITQEIDFTNTYKMEKQILKT